MRFKIQPVQYFDSQPPLFSYGLATLAVAAAAIATHYIPVIGERAVFLLFVFVIIQTAFWIGRNPALVAMMLSLIAANEFILYPFWRSSPYDVLILNVAFCLLAGCIIATTTLHRHLTATNREQQQDLCHAQAIGHIGSWRLNLQHNELHWSDENHRIFGIPKGTPMTYETFLSTVHPDDREYVDRKWQAALRGEPYDIEHRLVVAGKIKWVRERAELEFGKNEILLGGFGTTQDITERKCGEVALQNQLKLQDQLAKVTESVPGLICSFRMRPDGSASMPYASSVIESIYGFSHEAVAEDFSPVFARIHSDDIGHVNDTISDSARTLQPWQDTFRYDHPAKGERWIEGYSIPQRETDGSILWHGYIQDITERKQTEIELQERTARYELVLEGAQDAIWDWDVLNKSVHYSSRWKALRGFAEHEVGNSEEEWSATIHPDDRERVSTAIQSHFQRNTPVFCEEYRIRCKNGDWKWILDRGIAQRDKYGQVIRMAGSESDITDRKHAEAALRNTENELRQIMDATPALISYLDTDFRYLRANKAYENWFGVNLEQVIGHGVKEIIGEKAWRTVSRYLEKARAGEQISFDYQIQYGTGKPHWVHGYYIPDKDPNGTVKGIVVHIVDIEKIKLAEQALGESQQENEFLAGLIRSSSQPVSIGYPDGRIKLINTAFEELTGYSAEELQNLDWAIALTPPEWREIERNKMAELHRNGQPVRYEKEYIRKNGTRVPIDLLVQLVTGPEGKQRFYYAFLTDLTERKRTEAALRASEERLALGIQVAGLALMEVDYITGLSHLTVEAARLFGLGEKAQVVPRSKVHATCHPDDRKELMYRIAGSLDPNGDGWFAIDHRVVWPDGMVHWLRVREQVFFADENETRKPVRSTLAIHDITAEMTAAEAVRASESFVRGILNSLPQQIAVLDNNGVVSAVNEPWKNFAIENNGSPNAVSIGADYLEVCRNSSAAGDTYAQEALTGLEAMLAGNRQIFEMEYPCLTPSANRWFLLQAKRVCSSIEGIILSHMDITERKQAEEALHNSQARLALVIEEVKAGYWDWNLLTNTLYLSPEWMRQLGLNDNEMLVQWDQKKDRLHPEDRALVMATSENFIAGRLPVYELEFRLRHKNGSYRWIHSRGALLRDRKNQPTRMMGINLDITEYKKTKELQQRHEQMEQTFRLHIAIQTAAAIAHELNQPLTAISSYADVALQLFTTGNRNPQKLTHVLENCVLQAQRAGQVIRQLLNLLHKGEMSIEPIDINNSIYEALEFVTNDSQFGAFSIALDLAADLPKIAANSLQIQKVLINLLRNGLEAMQDSGATAEKLIVTTSNPADNPGFAQVTVSDNGKGIADIATLAKMFQPFYTTKATGLGMGLAISRTLIETHGGRMWAEQNAGNGISVHFTLPFAA